MAGDRVNLLFIFADEMRGQDMGHLGHPDVQTPTMDRLASEGVSFTNAISNCPVCTPSRGSILTGLHALGHHAISNDVPIRTDLPSLGTVLRDCGYATGYIGKWHLDGMPRERFTPPGARRLGFEEYWAVWNCHHEYFNGRYYLDEPTERRIEGYEPWGQTALAIKFLERHRHDAFGLVVSWGPPHGPLEIVPEEYRHRYDAGKLALRPNVRAGEGERRTLACAVPPWNSQAHANGCGCGEIEQAIRESLACYYAAITGLDDCLGRLLAALEQLDLVNNTVVVFTSDHGSMYWSQGRIRKQQPWEESIRVPLIIRAPGRLPVGLKSDVLTGLVDMTPTVLELLGQPLPDGMDGASVARQVLGQEPGREAVLIGIPVPVDGVTMDGVSRGWRGVRTKRHTYAQWEDGSDWVLYDNLKDPYQLSNLIDKPTAADLHVKLAAELQKQLELANDPFLTWQEQLIHCGVVDEWNLRERMFYPDGGRQVST